MNSRGMLVAVAALILLGSIASAAPNPLKRAVVAGVVASPMVKNKAKPFRVTLTLPKNATAKTAAFTASNTRSYRRIGMGMGGKKGLMGARRVTVGGVAKGTIDLGTLRVRVKSWRRS